MESTTDLTNIELALLIAALSFIILFRIIIPLIKFNSRMKFLNSLINDKKDTDMYLEEIEKDIKKKNSTFRDCFLLCKAIVLIVKGEEVQANEVLRIIKTERLKGIWKLTYYYNLILNLFEMKRINEAQIEFNKHYDKLIKLKNIERYKVAVSKLEAIYLYFCGEIEKSKEELSQLINMNTGNFNKAEIYFYLGLIYRDLGNVEEAKKYLTAATIVGKDTFIEGKANIRFKELL